MPTRFQKTRKNFKKKKITGGEIAIRQWTEKVPLEELKPKIYFTMDNNRKIYEIVDDFHGTGYKDIYKLNMDANNKYSRGKRVLHIKAPGTKFGYNKLYNKLYEPTDKTLGNFMIISKGNGVYLYVGHKIFTFRAINNDDISFADMFGPISKEGVSYPYLISKNYTYFFRENVAVPNTALGIKYGEGLDDIRKDPYNMFYGGAASWLEKKIINFSKKEFKIKMIDNGSGSGSGDKTSA
jgi:hypothetical protein